MRKAGDGNYYEYVLHDLSDGSYDKSNVIRFDSVTTIIHKTLAAPALVNWASRTTLDMVTGALAELDTSTLFVPGVDGLTPWENILDADELAAWLKENHLTHDEVRNIAAARGHKVHKRLEDACEAFEQGRTDDGEHEGMLRMGEYLSKNGPSDPFEIALTDWLESRLPNVVQSEKVLHSLHEGYAGTCDLIWRANDGTLTLTDLKTREPGRGTYDADHIQTGAYEIAWNETHPDEPIERRTVLLAQSDGTWAEDESWVDPEAFLHLKAVYDALKH